MTRRSLPIRHARGRSGIVVLLAVVIFFVALLQAGVLRDLFRSELELRVILPETGLSGLAAGADVQVLGTTAGQIDHIELDPKSNFYAIAKIDKSMEPFVRTDSKVFIRKQFGIAGAAYLDITRGRGRALDWDYAVLTVTVEAEPTASVGELVDELRVKVLPLIDDLTAVAGSARILMTSLSEPSGGLQSTLTNLSTVTGNVADGKGSVGRLVSNDTLAIELEQTMAELQTTLSSFSVIVGNLQKTTGDVATMTSDFAAQSGKLPEMIDNTNATLASLHGIMDEVGRTMPQVTEMMRNSAEASVALPTLLTQTQQTLAELQRLLVQLQGSWLLGGGGGGPGDGRVDRLSPIEARP